MQTSNARQNFRFDDPVWVLLAELSLRDFLPDHDRRDEPVAGFLFQTLRKLNMSPECMENIISTLTALVHTKQRRLEFPGRIRIFCQKKILGNANAAKTLRPPEPGKKQKQFFPDSSANTIGGWGYFMIERGEDLTLVSSAISHKHIDLYLYKEGE